MGFFDEHPEKKIITELPRLIRAVQSFRDLGYERVVATIGSWDLKHVGQERYLFKASQQGDLLVVGVDTDRAMKRYKGPARPIVPEDERCESLSYLSFVSLVTLVDDVDADGRWNYELLRAIRPDVFIAVESDSYSDEQLAEIKTFVGELVTLPRQALGASTTIFTERIKELHAAEIRAMAAGDPNA